MMMMMISTKKGIIRRWMREETVRGRRDRNKNETEENEKKEKWQRKKKDKNEKRSAGLWAG
jgi:hypothetical protein